MDSIHLCRVHESRSCQVISSDILMRQKAEQLEIIMLSYICICELLDGQCNVG